ncbi:MAG TPA: DUF2726 domain-containing protein [Methylococcus sp.]|nr:DUF2726 domain-containing protein [Methylococcus sp.]
MNPLWYGYGTLIALLLWLLLYVYVRARRRTRPVGPPCQAHRTLFGPEERFLFSVLKQAVGDEFEVFGKIRASEILRPRKGASRNEARDLLRAMAGRRFTFVLCHKADLSIAAIVEMNRHDHARKSLDAGDPAAELCRAAGLPLIPIQASPYYDPEEIRAAILEEVRREPVFPAELDGHRIEPRISSLDGLPF